MRLLGIILAILGVVLLLYGGLTLFIPAGATNVGAFTFSVNENLNVVLTPLAGLACLVVGVIMVLAAPRYYPPPPY